MSAADPVAAGRPDALEWTGWVALGLLTLAIVLLALLRPTDPDALYNEIRLAAGFDRYQAALDEGDRLYSTAVARSRTIADEPEAREPIYALLRSSIERFAEARAEAEGFYEDQRAQMRMAEAYLMWAGMLLQDGVGPWYRRNDVATLERARDLVDEGLALPNIRGDQRNRLEDLRREIGRAITPWPLL